MSLLGQTRTRLLAESSRPHRWAAHKKILWSLTMVGSDGIRINRIVVPNWDRCEQARHASVAQARGNCWALRACASGAPPLARWQMDDSERHARVRARPSNPPRRARRRPASLRHETNAKRPPEGGLFYISILGGERGIRTPDRFDPIHAFQACDFNRSSTSPATLPLSEKPRIIANNPHSTNFIWQLLLC